MKPFTRVLSAFAVGILLQGGVYLYLDQYMFAPTTDFNVAGASKDDTKNFPDVKEGTKYVSYDRQFMAVVTESSLKIYKANESKPTNYDTRRVYMQATDIGHIGVFYDEDRFFYDNAKTGDIFMFNGIEGGWRVINPPGRFRLIGVDMDKTIYIARVDEDNNALTVYTGKLGVGFKPVYKYNHPTTFNELTLSDVKTIIKDGSDETTKVTEDDTSSKSSSDSKKKS